MIGARVRHTGEGVKKVIGLGQSPMSGWREENKRGRAVFRANLVVTTLRVMSLPNFVEKKCVV